MGNHTICGSKTKSKPNGKIKLTQMERSKSFISVLQNLRKTLTTKRIRRLMMRMISIICNSIVLCFEYLKMYGSWSLQLLIYQLPNPESIRRSQQIRLTPEQIPSHRSLKMSLGLTLLPQCHMIRNERLGVIV